MTSRASFRISSHFLGLFAALLLLQACAWSPDDNLSEDSWRVTPDGYYTVRRGDSLHAIAFRFDLYWKDIAGWNGIKPPYVIYPDQQLRLKEPPQRQESLVSVRAARTPGSSSSRDVDTRPASSKSSPPPQKVQKPAVQPAAKPVAQAEQKVGEKKAPTPPPIKSSTPDPSSWAWPTEGRVISNFRSNDPARNGVDIGGKEGQPITAAASGEVVYSGNGLISYGELIIIKHSDRMLSAYGHNRQRLVKEGDRVTTGQKIAEMGRNDRNQALLHFEVRVNGTPQNPLKYLPKK